MAEQVFLLIFRLARWEKNRDPLPLFSLPTLDGDPPTVISHKVSLPLATEPHGEDGHETRARLRNPLWVGKSGFALPLGGPSWFACLRLKGENEPVDLGFLIEDPKQKDCLGGPESLRP